jgi:hypothetical protein
MDANFGKMKQILATFPDINFIVWFDQQESIWMDCKSHGLTIRFLPTGEIQLGVMKKLHMNSWWDINLVDDMDQLLFLCGAWLKELGEPGANRHAESNGDNSKNDTKCLDSRSNVGVVHTVPGHKIPTSNISIQKSNGNKKSCLVT